MYTGSALGGVNYTNSVHPKFLHLRCLRWASLSTLLGRRCDMLQCVPHSTPSVQERIHGNTAAMQTSSETAQTLVLVKGHTHTHMVHVT